MPEWSKYIVAGGIFENFTVGSAIMILMISYVIFLALATVVYDCLAEKGGKKMAVLMSLLRLSVHIAFVAVLILLYQIMFVYS